MALFTKHDINTLFSQEPGGRYPNDAATNDDNICAVRDRIGRYESAVPCTSDNLLVMLFVHC